MIINRKIQVWVNNSDEHRQAHNKFIENGAGRLYHKYYPRWMRLGTYSHTPDMLTTGSRSREDEGFVSLTFDQFMNNDISFDTHDRVAPGTIFKNVTTPAQIKREIAKHQAWRNQ